MSHVRSDKHKHLIQSFMSFHVPTPHRLELELDVMLKY